MGTNKEKRERLRLNELDLAKLNSMTRDMESFMLKNFDLKLLHSNWPIRYLFLKNEIEYEFIFSQMGSFTIRLAKSERYRRNPPPIFYLSVGKYFGDEFIWEDLNGEKVLDPLAEIFSSMEKYESNIQTFN